MVNADAELNSLRMYLLDGRGWTPQEVEQICDLASRDMNEVMLDVVSNAVAEATDYAIEIGADEFVEDMDVISVGGTFMITTLSGSADYSTPEKQMLPHLLKNAERSPTTGNRYKVIPVGSTNTTSIPKSSFGVAQERQKRLREARDVLAQNTQDKRSARADAMVNKFREVMHRNLAVKQEKQEAVHSNSDVTFRTATDKQNPSTDWVIPAKEMNLTGYLMELNKRVQDSIEQSVLYIVNSYKEEYA
jgi:hypothetical protein